MGTAIKPTTLQEMQSQAQPPLALMDEPPRDPVERDAIGRQLWMGLVLRFETRLTTAEKNMLRRPPPNPQSSPEYQRLVRSFDDFLLSAFAEFGWKLLMSRDVLARVAAWENTNPILAERFGKEMLLRSKICRGEKPSPVPDDIDTFVDSAIAELTELLRVQHKAFVKRTVPRTCARIGAWMKGEIEAHPEQYGTLLLELPQLIGWIESLPERNRDLALALVNSDLQARSFVLRWVSDLWGRALKDVQNVVSTRRTLRRKALSSGSRK